MAGVTDTAFRELCKRFGAALTCSEMVSGKALVYQDAKSKTLLPRGIGEHPYAVQIFGHEPDVMAAAAQKVMELAAPEIIDINMGCPTPKIVKNGDGSALMLNPALAAKIVRAVSAAVGDSAAVSVKIRSGRDSSHINAVELAKAAEDAGASAITVHGRTASQMYSGRSDPAVIAEVKAAVRVPVIANGDVASLEGAEELLTQTGADYAMVGRAAMGNPWIFSGVDKSTLPLSEIIAVALEQLERCSELKGERVACLEARKHFSWYLKGSRGAAKYKSRFVSAETLADFRALASELLGV
jgi:tRNA-dihydrouridine synthase B